MVSESKKPYKNILTDAKDNRRYFLIPVFRNIFNHKHMYKIGPRAENPDHLNKQNGGDIPDVGIVGDYEGKKFVFFTVR